MDPVYLSFCPQKVLSNTAIDAMGHMVESYLNTAATKESKKTALEGLKIWKDGKAVITGKRKIEPAKEGALDLDTSAVLSSMLKASNYGGRAIAVTGTMIPHALSYRLTYLGHVPHGAAIGIFLPGYMSHADPAEVRLLLDAMDFESLDAFTDFIRATCRIENLTSEKLDEIARIAIDDLVKDEARLKKRTLCCRPLRSRRHRTAGEEGLLLIKIAAAFLALAAIIQWGMSTACSGGGHPPELYDLHGVLPSARRADGQCAVFDHGRHHVHGPSLRIHQPAGGTDALSRHIISQTHVLGVVVIRSLIDRADREQRILPDIERQREIVVLAFPPASALDLDIMAVLRPDTLRKIIFTLSVLAENRSDQETFSQHILLIQIPAGRILRELQHHRPHHGDTGLMRDDRHVIEIRHQ